jgi:hypothetical protein
MDRQIRTIIQLRQIAKNIRIMFHAEIKIVVFG